MDKNQEKRTKLAQKLSIDYLHANVIAHRKEMFLPKKVLELPDGVKKRTLEAKWDENIRDYLRDTVFSWYDLTQAGKSCREIFEAQKQNAQSSLISYCIQPEQGKIGDLLDVFADDVRNDIDVGKFMQSYTTENNSREVIDLAVLYGSVCDAEKQKGIIRDVRPKIVDVAENMIMAGMDVLERRGYFKKKTQKSMGGFLDMIFDDQREQ